MADHNNGMLVNTNWKFILDEHETLDYPRMKEICISKKYFTGDPLGGIADISRIIIDMLFHFDIAAFRQLIL